MNKTKFFWVAGVAVVASIVDLVYMFWSRSNMGHKFGQASWGAGNLGSGHYNLMGIGKTLYTKPGLQKPNFYPKQGGFHK